eukprot:PhM_4_TR11271/c0_g1_i1/m.87570
MRDLRHRVAFLGDDNLWLGLEAAECGYPCSDSLDASSPDLVAAFMSISHTPSSFHTLLMDAKFEGSSEEMASGDGDGDAITYLEAQLAEQETILRKLQLFLTWMGF